MQFNRAESIGKDLADTARDYDPWMTQEREWLPSLRALSVVAAYLLTLEVGR
jgi:hypothetical protein